MSYQEIFANQVEEFLQHPYPVLIDARDIISFNTGHIEGALHIDGPSMGKLIRQRNNNPALLVYCYHGLLSRDVAEMITRFGFKNVSHLIGGWEAWTNYQISQDISKSSKFINEERIIANR